MFFSLLASASFLILSFVLKIALSEKGHVGFKSQSLLSWELQGPAARALELYKAAPPQEHPAAPTPRALPRPPTPAAPRKRRPGRGYLGAPSGTRAWPLRCARVGVAAWVPPLTVPQAPPPSAGSTAFATAHAPQVRACTSAVRIARACAFGSWSRRVRTSSPRKVGRVVVRSSLGIRATCLTPDVWLTRGVSKERCARMSITKPVLRYLSAVPGVLPLTSGPAS